MGIRSLLRKVFGRSAEPVPETSNASTSAAVPSQAERTPLDAAAELVAASFDNPTVPPQSAPRDREPGTVLTAPAPVTDPTVPEARRPSPPAAPEPPSPTPPAPSTPAPAEPEPAAAAQAEPEADAAAAHGEAAPRDYRIAATAFIGSVNGLLHDWSAGWVNVTLDEVVDELVQQLLAVLRPPGWATPTD